MDNKKALAILAVSARGAQLARHIGAQTSADVYVLCRYAEKEDIPFTALGEKVAEIFRTYKGLIFVMAQGIVTRVIAPCLNSKYTDPAVVTCDDTARFSISTASGHEGGANPLCAVVASITGAIPVITTATEAAKPYIIGLGTRKGVESIEVKEAIYHACQDSGIELKEVRFLASAWLKSNEQGLLRAALDLGIYIRFIPRFLFNTYTGNCEPTAASKYFDIPAVAEPSAILAGHYPVVVMAARSYGNVMAAVVKDTLWRNNE